jgi:hypothetical protein
MWCPQNKQLKSCHGVENLDCLMFCVHIVWEDFLLLTLRNWIYFPFIISPEICHYTHCTILAHYYYCCCCWQREWLCAECSAYVEICAGYRSSPFKWTGILNEKWLRETWILNLYVASAASIFGVSTSTKTNDRMCGRKTYCISIQNAASYVHANKFAQAKRCRVMFLEDGV